MRGAEAASVKRDADVRERQHRDGFCYEIPSFVHRSLRQVTDDLHKWTDMLAWDALKFEESEPAAARKLQQAASDGRLLLGNLDGYRKLLKQIDLSCGAPACGACGASGEGNTE